jgi:hypothetical protein
MGTAGGGSGPDWKQIADKQEHRLRSELGNETFDQVYEYLKKGKMKKKQSNDGSALKNSQEKLRQFVGKEKLNLAFEVDQLIFIQTMSNEK